MRIPAARSTAHALPSSKQPAADEAASARDDQEYEFGIFDAQYKPISLA